MRLLTNTPILSSKAIFWRMYNIIYDGADYSEMLTMNFFNYSDVKNIILVNNIVYIMYNVYIYLYIYIYIYIYYVSGP